MYDCRTRDAMSSAHHRLCAQPDSRISGWDRCRRISALLGWRGRPDFL